MPVQNGIRLMNPMLHSVRAHNSLYAIEVPKELWIADPEVTNWIAGANKLRNNQFSERLSNTPQVAGLGFCGQIQDFGHIFCHPIFYGEAKFPLQMASCHFYCR